MWQLVFTAFVLKVGNVGSWTDGRTRGECVSLGV